METEFCDQPLPGYKKGFSFVLSSLAMLLFSASIYAHKYHEIVLGTENIINTTGSDYLAYKMIKHCTYDADPLIAVVGDVTDVGCKGGVAGVDDITARYNNGATMPGPTLVITEEDIVFIKLKHEILVEPGQISPPLTDPRSHVSLHVHGVHYNILSDGTLTYINESGTDQSARPFIEYLYKWDAAPGTTGTWAYHDHNFMTHNGAEDRGLYGALIVNPHSGVTEVKNGGMKQSIAISDIAKENILFVLDDTFAGMQINNATDMHGPHGFNPDFTADKNTFVRFHVISMGTNAHKFQLSGYNWIDPGTRDIINMKPIGSLEKHFFVVKTNKNATYSDNTFFGKLLGMEGGFQVN
jgi:hypothetical protein